MMHVLALELELRLVDVHSLKAKRATIKPIVEGARRRFGVASAEIGAQDVWKSTVLGFAAVSGSSIHATDVIDQVERFAWSFPEVEVVAAHRGWLEMEDH